MPVAYARLPHPRMGVRERTPHAGTPLLDCCRFPTVV